MLAYFGRYYFWSDPVDEPGLALSDRGAGCLFGEDVTDSFLSLNKLKLIVRSHECVDDVCELRVLFSKKNLILFSCLVDFLFSRTQM